MHDSGGSAEAVQLSLLSRVVKLLEEEEKKQPKTALRTNYRKEDLQPRKGLLVAVYNPPSGAFGSIYGIYSAQYVSAYLPSSVGGPPFFLSMI